MVNRIEELLINSDPSSDIFVDNGFLVRCFSNGNVCAINRLVNNYSANYGEIIKSHASKLVKNNINPSYRIIHDSSYEALDQELVRQSYSIVEEGVVMALRIENMERELFSFANFYEQGIFTDEELGSEWLDDYRDLISMDPTHGKFFENNLKKSIQDHMYFGLFERDRLMGMGYITFIDNYMIIKDLFIEEKYRGLDYGKRLLKAMLIKGLLKGCTVALCEVGKKQQIAGRFLTSEGFEGLYSYHYRAKNLIGD